MIRLAQAEDLDAVARIYSEIHSAEERGEAVIGWDRHVYPTRGTAEDALRRGDLFVLEAEGAVRGAAIINRRQVEAYARGRWLYPAGEDEAMVLHTLVISPASSGKGYGRQFVRFYEDYALAQGCTVLRMDTNARNAAARHLYAALGYREADIVPCEFNGLPDVQLVLLEKRLDTEDRPRV